jgi:coenzyme F420-dependent glucose-6-phosphate dehydrogenase
LPLPRHFEQATENVTPEQLKEELTVGPDPKRYLASIQEMVEAGYTHVYFHQIGPDQEGFFRFWKDELAPQLTR